MHLITRTLPNSFYLATVAILFALLALGSVTQAQDADYEVDPSLYDALEWREVGPSRGGRSAAVTGVPSLSNVYYMGASGGGVWKSENAGQTWDNISDDFFKTGGVGAVAVSLSDPSVIYVGTGEAPFRNQTSTHGDGVYKSTDAGKTWVHLGLEATRQISRIRIHPNNPDIVYVAAQGNPWGASEERGVYRSTDGGKTWELMLKTTDESGAVDLSMDAHNPRILYAAMWDHGRKPWFVRSGGPGGGIYKTTDSGDTWQKLEDGLPEFVGKIGVAVSPANPERVYAIIEAEEGGLFRSDDGGASWDRINGARDTYARAWYYTHIAADFQMARLIRIAYLTALRKSDIVAIQWKDLKDGALYVVQQKTKTPVAFSLDGELGQLFNELRKGRKVLSPYVFINKHNTNVSDRTVDTYWWRVRAKSGIENVVFHDLRRKRLTDLTTSHGEQFAQRVAGHKDRKSTARYYTPDVIRIELPA
jgi:photosystem II stability/assembly factor-like uncharacterized protein